MRNFEKRLLNNNDKLLIKKLWIECFHDDEININIFLDFVFENEKGAGIFFGDELISMILFLNSEFIFKNKNKNAIYFYAVCTKSDFRNKGLIKELFLFSKTILGNKKTDYLFLVPENFDLFKMYEKFDFENKIKYKEKIIHKKEFEEKNIKKEFPENQENLFGIENSKKLYEIYKKIKLKQSQKNPVVLWRENEFNYIFNKKRNDVKILFEPNGYAVYEVFGDNVKIHEISGEEEKLFDFIFSKETAVSHITVNSPCDENDTEILNQGMVFDFNGINDSDFNFIYFGMPYA